MGRSAAAFGVTIFGVKITVCSLTPSRAGIMTSRLVNCEVSWAVAAVRANARTGREFISKQATPTRQTPQTREMSQTSQTSQTLRARVLVTVSAGNIAVRAALRQRA